MNKISTNEITKAKDSVELHQMVKDAAVERNCELNDSRAYLENADFFKQEASERGSEGDGMFEMVEILHAAHKRWHQIDDAYDKFYGNATGIFGNATGIFDNAKDIPGDISGDISGKKSMLMLNLHE